MTRTRRSRSTRCGVTGLIVALGVAAIASGAAADGNEAPLAPVGARSVAAGDLHTCALLDDATVRCWGDNLNGQLGQDTTDALGDEPGEMAALDPVDLGPGRTATAVTAGRHHTCALLDDATVKCWGNNFSGQLGQGTTDALGDEPGEMAALDPVDLGPGRTATAITGGDFHTCALLDDATVKCWGVGTIGALGQDNNATIGDQPGEMAALGPVNLGPGRTATAVTAGQYHTCALLDDATVKCWGYNGNGELGQDNGATLGDQPGEMAALDPIDLGPGRTATAIAAGGYHTCALLDNATVKCWGSGGNGALGQDSTATLGDQPGEMAALDPIDLGPGRTATAVTTGRFHTCARLDNATVKCWGGNGQGQLGQDSTDTLGDQPGEMAALQPINLGPGRTASAVTTGGYHTCALLDDATVKCWGWNQGGQLGQDNLDTLGDQPGEMAALDPIDLGPGRTVGPRPAVAVSIAPAPGPVVVGQDIDYQVTVTNTGGAPLTGIEVLAPDAPDCATEVALLTAGQAHQHPCTYTTTDDDVPVMTNQVLVITDQGVFALSGTRRTRVDPQVLRPDGQVRLAAGPFAGNGVYNTNGAGQARAATVRNLGTATFTVRIQNDGNTTEAFTVQGPGTTSRFTVTYKNGPTNVTAPVLAGTFTTDPLAPGATQDLTLTIKAKAGTPVGNTLSRTVTITSQTAPTVKDAVKATVTRR